ncbi:OrNVorf41-like-6 [Venturia canescens]|uniref:OrNVorf41-like-6 n=1 Tax=Venturia canescens TaxID=32260 RepID=A0ACB9ZLD7_9HYME|nr:OrNVorf41-like-6 [Venturia canescens]
MPDEKSTKSANEKFIKKVTPQCWNLAKWVKISGYMVIIFTVLTALCLFVAIIMDHAMRKCTEEEKSDIPRILVGVSFGFIIATCLLGIWQYTVGAKTTRVCIIPPWMERMP